MKQGTFRDLYNYIQTSERDSNGMHFPFYPDKLNALHIYEGKKQVNVSRLDENNECFIPIGNFVFNAEDETVDMFSVDNGVCDYSTPHTYPIDSVITIKNIPIDSNYLISSILRDIRY